MNDSATYGKDYKLALRDLQVQLVTLQKHLIKHQLKVLVLFEGRDASGKDGIIKRITQHLSPRETRTVALGKPSERDRNAWYFQRFCPYLPVAQEMVLMNRSWYNRAGVERVMGFCTDDEAEDFLNSVTAFEAMLVRSGIQILKYYLDISKNEQRQRLEARRSDPLKQWKISPIDQVAIEHWNDYSTARNAMLSRTHNDVTPWHIVNADSKKAARINVIRHLLRHIECPDHHSHAPGVDDHIVYRFDSSQLDNGSIYP